MNKERLINQLFIGKVSYILGFEKTMKLLKEANEVINSLDVNEEQNKTPTT
jgi:hypothetical protein